MYTYNMYVNMIYIYIYRIYITGTLNNQCLKWMFAEFHGETTLVSSNDLESSNGNNGTNI